MIILIIEYEFYLKHDVDKDIILKLNATNYDMLSNKYTVSNKIQFYHILYIRSEEKYYFV